MRVMIAALAAAVLAGCASPQYNYVPASQSFSEPPLGSVVTVGVGEKMLSQGLAVRQDAVRVLAPIDVSVGHSIGPGLYLKTGNDATAEYFMPRQGDDGGKLGRRSTIFEMPISVMLKTDGSLCVVTVSTQYLCSKEARYERTKVDIVTERSFQQTLIYSGKVGNKINIGYREFTSNIARMGFNNNVEYDLSESPLIGYRGAELEILEATNRSIRYRVIRNFADSAR